MMHHRLSVPCVWCPPRLGVRPHLFFTYTAPVVKIISKYNLMFHLCADDTQIYLSVKPLQTDVAAAVERIEGCVAKIMSFNFLILNDKTVVIIFCSALQLKQIELHAIHIGDSLITVSHYVRNLGVQFNETRTMELRITAVYRSAIYHLRSIASSRRYLAPGATEQNVHAFVTSRLDVGNASLYRLPFKQTQRLLSTELGGPPRGWCTKFCRATPLLRELH